MIKVPQTISEVFIDFNLLSINELSEVTETLKTTGYLFISWNDTFLTWDPDDYGGLYIYQFPQVSSTFSEHCYLSDMCMVGNKGQNSITGAPVLKYCRLIDSSAKFNRLIKSTVKFSN